MNIALSMLAVLFCFARAVCATSEGLRADPLIVVVVVAPGVDCSCACSTANPVLDYAEWCDDTTLCVSITNVRVTKTSPRCSGSPGVECNIAPPNPRCSVEIKCDVSAVDNCCCPGSNGADVDFNDPNASPNGAMGTQAVAFGATIEVVAWNDSPCGSGAETVEVAIRCHGATSPTARVAFNIYCSNCGA